MAGRDKGDRGGEQVRTYPHLRISGLRKASRSIHRKYQGWPRTRSETVCTSHSAACGSLPLYGWPSKASVLGSFLFLFPSSFLLLPLLQLCQVLVMQWNFSKFCHTCTEHDMAISFILIRILDELSENAVICVYVNLLVF